MAAFCDVNAATFFTSRANSPNDSMTDDISRANGRNRPNTHKRYLSNGNDNAKGTTKDGNTETGTAAEKHVPTRQ